MENQKEKNVAVARERVDQVKIYLNRIRSDFMLVGLELYKLQNSPHIGALGYKTFDDMVEAEFGFSRSTAYDMIKVFWRFCDRSNGGTYSGLLGSKYQDYSYSQLVALTRADIVPMPVQKYIPPDSSVRDIQAYIKAMNKHMWRDFGTLPEWKAEEERKAKELAEAVQTSGQRTEEPDEQLAIEEAAPAPAENVQTSGQGEELYSSEDLIPQNQYGALCELVDDWLKMFGVRVVLNNTDVVLGAQTVVGQLRNLFMDKGYVLGKKK